MADLTLDTVRYIGKQNNYGINSLKSSTRSKELRVLLHTCACFLLLVAVCLHHRLSFKFFDTTDGILSISKSVRIDIVRKNTNIN